jgi:hypothetical protein
MGGFGSGPPLQRVRVEACLILSAGRLVLLAAEWPLGLRHELTVAAPVVWNNSTTGEPVCSLRYEVNTMRADAAWLHLEHTTRTRPVATVDYGALLTTTPLPWGGVRWAFLCPGLNCGRVCRKLYLPPGGRYFLCRLCYRPPLTYTSAQEAHAHDRVDRLVGMPPGTLADLFRDNRRTRKKHLAIRKRGRLSGFVW